MDTSANGASSPPPPHAELPLRQWQTAAAHVGFDPQRGVLRSLQPLDRAVDFMGHALNNPHFGDSTAPGLGDLRLRVSRGGGPWQLEETRFSRANLTSAADPTALVVNYPADARQPTGMRSLDVTQTWQPPATDGSHAPWLQWRVRLTPTEGARSPLRIGELSLPLPLNTHFGGHGDQDLIYDHRVMLHPFCCGHGGWVLAQRLSGRPPFLLLVPTRATPLEAMAHDNERFAAGGGWDGLLWLFCWSAAAAECLNWGTWFNGHRYIDLAPGAALEIGFDFHWVADQHEMESVLHEAGHATFRSHPGYVLPADQPALLHIRPGRDTGVSELASPDCCMRRETTTSAEHVYALDFQRPGEHALRVTYDDGRWTNLLYHVIPAQRDHLATRAHFITEKQFFRRPGHRMDRAFLMWDAETRDVVLDAPDTPWLTGGSDEGGLADPLVLAARNARWPDVGEIAVLEEYVDRFLFGVLQRPGDYGIRNWVQHSGDLDAGWGGQTNRSYNYPHVWCIYLALHEVGRRYGLTRVRTAMEYLELAYRTARAYFTLPMHKEHHLTKGNMNEDTLDALRAACRTAGRDDWADDLAQLIAPKTEYMCRHTNPYLSELNFDTTGYPGVYFYRRRAGGVSAAAPTLAVIHATRHPMPGWPWFASDVRWGWGNSKFRSGDEIVFNYMTSQNAVPLLDAYERTGDPAHLRLAYAALLAVWVLVEPDGTAHDFYGWEPGRRRFDPWTSEMGQALFPTIWYSTAYVLRDADFGLIGYGCHATQDSAGLTILPRDLTRQRVHIAADTLPTRGPWPADPSAACVIEAADAEVRRVVLSQNGAIAVELAALAESATAVHLRVSGLSADQRVRIATPAGDVTPCAASELATRGVQIPLAGGTVTATVHPVAGA